MWRIRRNAAARCLAALLAVLLVVVQGQASAALSASDPSTLWCGPTALSAESRAALAEILGEGEQEAPDAGSHCLACVAPTGQLALPPAPVAEAPRPLRPATHRNDLAEEARPPHACGPPVGGRAPPSL